MLMHLSGQMGQAITDFRIENGDIIFVLDTSKVLLAINVILFTTEGDSMVIKNATRSDVRINHG